MGTFEIDFAQQIPTIECGITNIKLGVFTKLSRNYRKTVGLDQAVPLAFCVTRGIFFDSISQPTMEEYAQRNAKVVEEKIKAAFSDKELAQAIPLVYAVRIMVLGWQTHNPFNDNANRIVERATEYGIEIPNITQAWGSNAIVKFFQYSTNFVNNSMQA